MSLILDALRKIQKLKMERQQRNQTTGSSFPWLSSRRKSWRFPVKWIIPIGVTIPILFFFTLYKQRIFKPMVATVPPAATRQESLPENNVLFKILDENFTGSSPKKEGNREELQTSDSGKNTQVLVAAKSPPQEAGPVSLIEKAQKEMTKEESPIAAIVPEPQVQSLPEKETSLNEAETAVAVVPTPGSSPVPPAEQLKDSRVIIHSVDKQDAIDSFNRALFYYKESNLHESMEEYKKVLELDPSNAQAHNNLGMVYYDLGMLNDAINQYQKAIAISPRYDKAHHNLAVAYYVKGDLSKAAFDFTMAIEYNPKNPESYNNLALVLRKQNRLAEARCILKKGLSEASTRYPPFHYNLALTLEDEGNEKEAAFHYRKFIELSSDDQSDLVEKVKRHLSLISSHEHP
ncbi:MAG: tetratricopeptide repeat protein [Candidatus Brocadiales bacterium]|nr:tetratricopeptide repeat protein [Candidatus Brocadiales bacterium]